MQPTVAFVIPCHNEAHSITQVIEDCRRTYPLGRVIVFDNLSTDSTSELARAKGAEVIHAPLPGKGSVVRQAFLELNEDFIVLIDGDGTYSLKNFKQMLNSALQNFAMVTCRRESAKGVRAYRRFHFIGNLLFSILISCLIRKRIRDPLTGLRILPRKLYKSLSLKAQNFEIEAELSFMTRLRKAEIIELPGEYFPRKPGSISKLKTFHDGFKILIFLAKLAARNYTLI